MPYDFNNDYNSDFAISPWPPGPIPVGTTATTVNNILTQAMKKAGILGLGQTSDGGDLVDALADLNDMIAQWNTQRWMVWDLVNIGYVSTATSPLTIGPGGNFNVATRPTRIESCFQRQLIVSGLNVDTPIEIIPSWEEYSRLSLKQLQSFTIYCFYDGAYPLGNLYLYPIPNAAIYEIFVQFKDAIPVFSLANMGTVLSVPPQYIAALKFNLAKRLRQAYGKGLRPDPELNALARSSLDIVKQSSLQIPELVMPRTLIIQSSGYNILSDQFGNG